MTQPTTMSPLLTVQQASALLGVSDKTVRRRIYAGDLPAFDYGTGGQPLYRIRQHDLNKIGARVRGARGYNAKDQAFPMAVKA